MLGSESNMHSLCPILGARFADRNRPSNSALYHALIGHPLTFDQGSAEKRDSGFRDAAFRKLVSVRMVWTIFLVALRLCVQDGGCVTNNP